MTNNPKKIIGLSGYGLEVVERVKIEIPPNKVNKKYLATKRDKLGHLLTLIDDEAEPEKQELLITNVESKA